MSTLLQKLRLAGGRLVLAVAVLASMAAWSTVKAADDYPKQRINIVVGFPPGGGTDVLARLVADALSSEFGVPVTVENRPGATATVGTQYVVDSAPDGHTLLVATTGSIVLAPHTIPNLGYDPVTDLAPVIQLGAIGSILTVRADSPYANVEDFIAAAREAPGNLTYGHSGVGSPQHLAGILLAKQADVDLVAVAYQGASPGIVALLGGETDALFTQPQNVAEHVADGGIRILGISRMERSENYPEIPTIAEQGYPEYQLTNWYSVFAPAGTPDAIIRKLNETILASLDAPKLQDFLRSADAERGATTPEELGELVRNELAIYAELLSGLEIQ